MVNGKGVRGDLYPVFLCEPGHFLPQKALGIVIRQNSSEGEDLAGGDGFYEDLILHFIFPVFPIQLFQEGSLIFCCKSSGNLRDLETAVAQINDLIQGGNLVGRVHTVAGPGVCAGRFQKAGFVVIAQHPDGYLRQF